MREITRISLKNKDTADISSLIEVALAAYNYPGEPKIRYSFIFEEVLLKWQKDYDNGNSVDFTRYESASDFRFEISIKGDKDNPLTENTSDDIGESLISILKSGLGQELRYRYNSGRNCVYVTLPKKNHEKKIFERNMFSLSVPVILQVLILNLASVIDSVMLSYYSQSALSAASLVSQYTSLFSAFNMAVGTGFTVILSKYWTKRDFKSSNHVVSMIFIIQGIIGLVFFALAEFAPKFIMNLYTNIPEVYEQGVVYLKAVAFYYLFTSLAEVYLGFMRNVKEVSKSSSYVIISQVVNCILNGFLIFGLCGFPRLGIAGAGISTSVSGLALIVFVAIDYKKSDLLRLKLQDFTKITKELWIEYFSFALPLIAQHVSYFAAVNVISAIIGHTSTSAVSAVAIKTTMFNIVGSVRMGTGTIASLVMSSNMNAKRKDTALKNSRFLIVYLLKMSFTMSVLFALTRLLIPYMFGDIPAETIYYINLLWVVTILTIFFSGMNHVVVTGILLSSGDTKFLLIVDAIVMWGCIVPGMLLGLYVFHLPIYIILGISCLDELVSFPLKYRRYSSLKWYNKLCDKHS